jgi:hypothetical protein
MCARRWPHATVTTGFGVGLALRESLMPTQPGAGGRQPGRTAVPFHLPAGLEVTLEQQAPTQ